MRDERRCRVGAQGKWSPSRRAGCFGEPRAGSRALGKREESAEGPRDQSAAARDPRRPRTGKGGVEFWANEDDAWVERWEQTQPPTPGPPDAERRGARALRRAGPAEDWRAPDTHPPPSGCRAGTSWPGRCLPPPAPERPVPGAPGRGPAPAGRAAARGSAWSRREALGARGEAGRRVRSPRGGGSARRTWRSAAAAAGPHFIRKSRRGGGAGGSAGADPSALTSPYSEPGRRDSRRRKPSVSPPNDGKAECTASLSLSPWSRSPSHPRRRRPHAAQRSRPDPRLGARLPR